MIALDISSTRLLYVLVLDCRTTGGEGGYCRVVCTADIALLPRQVLFVELRNQSLELRLSDRSCEHKSLVESLIESLIAVAQAREDSDIAQAREASDNRRN